MHSRRPTARVRPEWCSSVRFGRRESPRGDENECAYLWSPGEALATVTIWATAWGSWRTRAPSIRNPVCGPDFTGFLDPRGNPTCAGRCTAPNGEYSQTRALDRPSKQYTKLAPGPSTGAHVLRASSDEPPTSRPCVPRQDTETKSSRLEYYSGLFGAPSFCF